MTDDIPGVRRKIAQFRETVVNDTPLYTRLSVAVEEAPDVLGLLTERQAGQPPANLLFAAVQYLLAAYYPGDPLARFYPSLVAEPDGGDAAPAFLAFCRAHGEEIRALVRSRRTNTSAPARAAVLLAGLAEIAARLGGAPLHLVEIGCGLGSNLLIDRYRYDFGGFQLGPADAAVIHHCELRGGTPEALASGQLPVVRSRIGMELVPVDAMDDDAVRWLRALIYADALWRHRAFDDIIAMIRAVRPPKIQGDATTDLGPLLRTLPEGEAVVVFHSLVTYQINRAGKAAIRAALEAEATRRPLFRLGMEWVAGDPLLGLVDYRQPFEPRVEKLADCQGHGQWLDWNPQPAKEDALCL